MAKGLYISKALAIATIVLTVSAVCGIVLMVILYQMQIENNPPERPPSPRPTTPLPSGPPPTLRLPDYLIPERYQVYLQVYHQHTKLPNVTEQDFFKGNSTVTFKCVKDTWSIFLHAVLLNITNVVVTHSDTQKKIDVKSYTLHDDLNFLEIQLKEVLVGNLSYYDLFTEFDGELQADLAGLYSSQYTEKVDGEDVERFLVASQMQPTDARRVFPCFDEPAMKAVFDIIIIHMDGTTALSNTAGTDKYVYMEDGTRWIATRFQSTQVMSTYLLAIAVIENKFGSKSVITDDSKEMKIWARPEAVNAGHADYASVITGKILKFYEKLFQMNYPLNKLDQIAVPDFSGSGMENWGLIMYRESALLYEEGVSSISNKEWIASVVAHELAHQWFGNLVTMKWWNNLWLNEGFATFLSYIAVNATEPTWHIIDLIILKEIRVAMEFDSLNSSHPLSYPESEVENPYEISELFDSITYSKGAAVLRMLYTYIEEKAFIQGLITYLNKFQYKNVDNENLWECFQESTHKDVAGVMKPWIEQAGYPVITIDTSNGEIAQEQFFINRIEDQGLVWQVPIKFVKSGSEIQNDLLTEKGPITTPAYEVKDDAWLLANINCTGYYRVNYDEQNWNKLINQLESNHYAIPLISRGQLIDDAFHLARAKYINVTLALTTTKYLINETEYVPWESALNNLQYFMLMFDRSEVYGPMQKYLRKQVAPLYEYFKEYTENATVPLGLAEQYNQINAISVACSSSFPDCTAMARSLFNEWKNGTNRIPPNLKSTIYCHAIATGDEDDWDFAWEKYKSATIATEKDKLRYALSCTKKVWLLNRYLDYTLDPNKIRPMDAVSTINYIANNVVGQALAWDFIRSHWTYIGQEYVIMFDDSLINEVTQRFSTDFELQQLRDFQRQCSEDESCVVRRTLEQVIERTEANNKWVKENQQTVLNWFKSQVL